MTSSGVSLENFLIPLEEIKLATGNFSYANKIAQLVEFGTVYKGQLSKRWKNQTAAFKSFVGKHRREDFQYDFQFESYIHDGSYGREKFLNELKFISSFNHENIIRFIGYCDEDDEMVIVYEYATNGSLANHLQDLDKRSSLTWVQRLQICMEAAKGLNYLHSGLAELGRVIHGSVTASHIFLDENLKVKIWGFDFSVVIPENQPRPQVYKPGVRYSDYRDPNYLATYLLNPESDVYSFGVLLFIILTRPSIFVKPQYYEADKPKSLVILVQRCYDNGLHNLIDPVIRDQMRGLSFRMIKEIAYKCVSYNIKDRPSMDGIIKTIQEALDIHNKEAASAIRKGSSEYQNLKQFLIPLEEIKLATGNFSRESLVERYYTTDDVYKGQLSSRWENRIVINRRRKHKYRDDFDKELEITTRFHHENIIRFIGYCDEGEEMILVFEHAVNGRLYDHLKDWAMRGRLSWVQRLKICIGVAKGLKYLHSGIWDENKVVHRYLTN